MKDIQAILEGIIFAVGDEGISLDSLAKLCNLGSLDIQKLLDEMIINYTNDENRGIELVCYGGNYKFVSKALAHPYIQQLLVVDDHKAYSQSALETLAIIAYKQPLTRVEIEEIRSVGCEMMLRKLQAKGLIKELGRSDAPGKPILYGVTEAFLDSFKLKSLEELPPLPEFNDEEPSEQLFD